MNSDDTFFAQDDEFWANYLKGRPAVPASFFSRIFNYHQDNGGSFGTMSDTMTWAKRERRRLA